MIGRPACLDCEYGERQTNGAFSQYLPVEEIPVICRCPMKKGGVCTCRWDE